jgi:hypothetical protein
MSYFGEGYGASGNDNRLDRDSREEGEKKQGIANTILKIGTLGGKIKPNKKTIHLYLPGKGVGVGSMVAPNLSRIREKTRLRVRGFR